MLGDVNKLFVFKSLLTTPSNVLPLHLKQTFPHIIWIFTKGEGDGIKSRLHFKIFSTLPLMFCTVSDLESLPSEIVFLRLLKKSSLLAKLRSFIEFVEIILHELSCTYKWAQNVTIDKSITNKLFSGEKQWRPTTNVEYGGQVMYSTVVDRVMKSKLSHIPHNQCYPRVLTKKGYWMSYSSTSQYLAILCNQLLCFFLWGKNWNF